MKVIEFFKIIIIIKYVVTDLPYLNNAKHWYIFNIHKNVSNIAQNLINIKEVYQFLNKTKKLKRLKVPKLKQQQKLKIIEMIE